VTIERANEANRTVGTRGIQRIVTGFIDLEELEALPRKRP